MLGSQLLWGQQQSYQGYMDAGDDAVAQHDFYSAYQFYRVALDWPKKGNDPAALYKLGSSAYMARAYRVSIDALTKLGTTPKAVEYPLYKYYLAESYFRLGQYDQAVVFYNQFIEEQPNADQALINQSELYIAHANTAIEEQMDEVDLQVRHLGPPINSEYSDYGYYRGPDNQVYFSSHKFDYETDTLNPRRNLSRILQYGGGEEPKSLDPAINLPNRIVAHTTYNRAGTIAYFSICEYVSYDETRCDLYRADVAANGVWENPQALTALNDPAATNAMPSTGFSGETGQEYLYFSSDRAGGKGGMDIYRTSLAADGSTSSPVNLTVVNTAGNDVAPFFYTPRQTLFFATDGLFTFGGLDLYKSYLIDDSFRAPLNLGASLNSSFDDAYYAQFETEERAYFSSTRQAPDAVYFDGDKEVCCYDIYSFVPDNRVDLIVTTFNKINATPLLGTMVGLYEVTANGPVLIEEITNVEGNDFTFKLEPGRKYQLIATKDGFSKALDTFDLNDPELSKLPVIEREMYLAPTIELDVLTFNSNDDSELAGATVSLYRIDEDGNEILVKTLTNPDANDFNYELEYGNLYHIVGTRPGFGTATNEVDLRGVEPDGSSKITKELHFGQLLEIYVFDGITKDPLPGATVDLARDNGERVGRDTNVDGNKFEYVVNLNRPFVLETSRPEYLTRNLNLTFTQEDLDRNDGRLVYNVYLYRNNIDNLLPIAVYFDNDHPNPRSRSRTTRLSYDETYYPYISRRDTFIEEYTAEMDDEEKFVTGGRFRQFFKIQVEEGWVQLQAFAELLEVHLEAGNQFTIQLTGFASPRALNDYNLRLSDRRNASVRNFFRTWNNGVLSDYITDGDLKFTSTGLGEDHLETSEAINDRLDNPRESIFSIIASLQRKVELSNADADGNASRRRK